MNNSQNSLLKIFNTYTFTTATQILLSALDISELKQLLEAIQRSSEYHHLTHLVRTRIFIIISDQSDRNIYFVHYNLIDMNIFKGERCNFVAGNCQPNILKNIIHRYGYLIEKGNIMFGEKMNNLKEAAFCPELALPPNRRATVAPHCQTVYQIILACRKLKLQNQFMQPIINICQSGRTTAYFFEILELQIEMIDFYLSSLLNSFEHFAELTYRFMVYRNTVLALNDICPFPKLTSTMKLWSSRMHKHYDLAHKIFIQLIGLKSQKDANFVGYGLLNVQQLKDEGYLVDYVEGLVDQSINQNLVAYCGHSRQIFEGEYSYFEELILETIQNEINSQRPQTLQELLVKFQNLRSCGLKPVTLRKIYELLVQVENNQNMNKQNLCCRQDDYIQTCARINGLGHIDNQIYHLQCFS